MKINTDDKVMIVNVDGALARFAGKIGRVDRIHYETIPPIAIVQFDDDAICTFNKVPIENLVKVKIETKAETAREIPEGAKKISRADFKAAIMRVVHPDNVLSERSGGGMPGLLKGITTMIVGDQVEEAIFKDKDVVIMTKDEFVSTLWSTYNPVTISESVKRGLSAGECMRVAITAIIGLEEIVGIIFGGSND